MTNPEQNTADQSKKLSFKFLQSTADTLFNVKAALKRGTSIESKISMLHLLNAVSDIESHIEIRVVKKDGKVEGFQVELISDKAIDEVRNLTEEEIITKLVPCFVKKFNPAPTSFEGLDEAIDQILAGMCSCGDCDEDSDDENTFSDEEFDEAKPGEQVAS